MVFFYFKDVSRVEQLQAAKFSGMSGKSIIFLDFSRQAGLDAPELPGEHRLKKVAKQLDQLFAKRRGYKQERPS